MSDALRFERLQPEDFFLVDLQESQREQYGLPITDMTIDEAAFHAQGESWTAWDGDQALACFGITETFPDCQGTAWAFLGRDIGARHLQLTRFARDEVIGKSRLRRIEAIVRCADVDRSFARTAQVLDALRHPTPEIRWMLALGFEPAHVLHRYGAGDQTHMLMEVIR